MMQQLHVHPKLLGAVIRKRPTGGQLTIVACWMEEMENKNLRPKFTVLGVGVDGECFKVFLPDIDWEVVSAIV